MQELVFNGCPWAIHYLYSREVVLQVLNMTEAKNAETLNENHNQTPIGTLAHDGSKTRTGEQLETDIETRVNVEKSIIDAALLLLREYGVRKSGAALRDAVETPHDHLGERSSQRNFEFRI